MQQIYNAIQAPTPRKKLRFAPVFKNCKTIIQHKLYDMLYLFFVGFNSRYEWIQVDLLNPKFISKLRIAPPDQSENRFVLKFKLTCSLDGWVFEEFKDHAMGVSGLTFLGSNQELTFNLFPHMCRYVRLFPKTWKTRIALRWDLFACSSKWIN